MKAFITSVAVNSNVLAYSLGESIVNLTHDVEFLCDLGDRSTLTLSFQGVNPTLFRSYDPGDEYSVEVKVTSIPKPEILEFK